MALQKEISISSGVILTQAYILINKIELFNISNETKVHVLIYKDITSYTEGKPEVISLNHLCADTDYDTYFQESVLQISSNSPLNRAYIWLLTLPQYSGATEV